MATAGRRKNGSLTAREREILGLLATGLSGADIAAQLVLSPETVRTHVRNAMAKLGAATRSQAVVMALQLEGDGPQPLATQAPSPARSDRASLPGLDALLSGLAEIHEIESAAAYLADEDGLSLRVVEPGDAKPAAKRPAPEVLALGEGPIGRVALERRAQLVPTVNGSMRKPTIVAPMVASGRLVGVLALATRPSRPTGRGELLLAQAFAARIGEILDGGGEDASRRLAQAVARFRASWSATT